MVQEQKENRQTSEIAVQPTVEEVTEDSAECLTTEVVPAVDSETAEEQEKEEAVEGTAEEKLAEASEKEAVSATDAQQLEEISTLRAQSQANKAHELEKGKAMMAALL